MDKEVLQRQFVILAQELFPGEISEIDGWTLLGWIESKGWVFDMSFYLWGIDTPDPYPEWTVKLRCSPHPLFCEEGGDRYLALLQALIQLLTAVFH